MSNEVINDILVKAIEAATATGEFLGEQVPLLVQELILYHILWHSLWAVFWSAPVVASLYSAPRVYRFLKKDYSEELVMPYIVFTFLSTIPLTFNFFAALKWTLAPRVALLEYAASLVR